MTEGWKWLATTLGGFVIGLVLASVFAALQFNSYFHIQQDHENLDGHPVMMQRVGGIERDIAEVKDLIQQLDAKMDRVIEGRE